MLIIVICRFKIIFYSLMVLFLDVVNEGKIIDLIVDFYCRWRCMFFLYYLKGNLILFSKKSKVLKYLFKNM